ncbi:MAG: hypothetical protein AVDCRST_MAG36-1152, partial [uncultured Nocardioidaceae bacterium]
SAGGWPTGSATHPRSSRPCGTGWRRCGVVVRRRSRT